MYYNIVNVIPFCAIFTFVLASFSDSWSIWCSTLLCADLTFVAVCMSKASLLKSIPNRRAEVMIWTRATSFGMTMLPALVLVYLDGMLWDSFIRNVSRVVNGFLVFLVVVLHIFYYEVVKEEGESEKRN
jgi:hypothetical protein